VRVLAFTSSTKPTAYVFMSAGSLFFIAEIAQVMTKTRRFDSPNSSNRVNSGWPHQSKRQFSGYFPISKTWVCGIAWILNEGLHLIIGIKCDFKVLLSLSACAKDSFLYQNREWKALNGIPALLTNRGTLSFCLISWKSTHSSNQVVKPESQSLRTRQLG
jgi:hypothetical protein